MPLTDDQLDRYARHIILKEVGGAGQAKLLKARVLVIGAGGLGAPLLMYLAAAGVGTLGIVDDDLVSLSNLQRQIIHTTPKLGIQKTDSAAAMLAAINPDVKTELHTVRLNDRNATALIRQYDIVADGSDNFETRFLLNDVCYAERKPLVSAALSQFEAQLTTYRAYEPGTNPCYRCLFPAPPPPGSVQNCAEAGILGALAGIMGSMQALEVIKEILTLGESLAGQLLIYDALSARTRKVRFRKDPDCPLCSTHATHDNRQDGPTGKTATN